MNLIVMILRSFRPHDVMCAIRDEGHTSSCFHILSIRLSASFREDIGETEQYSSHGNGATMTTGLARPQVAWKQV